MSAFIWDTVCWSGVKRTCIFHFICRWSTRNSQKNNIRIHEDMGFDDLIWSKQCSTVSKEQMENGKNYFVLVYESYRLLFGLCLKV
jgi:hypothetical protein